MRCSEYCIHLYIRVLLIRTLTTTKMVLEVKEGDEEREEEVEGG